ncbi:hypothetical protein HZC08_00655 [Candidatus Micrarchaeota archaeon]|nr:hypothetical protein [Candidatus Micrarchaeota archaeon]
MKTITVVAQDKVGLLAELSYILGKSKIQIDGIGVETAGEKAIISISTARPERAEEILQNNGYDLSRSREFFIKSSDLQGPELLEVTKILRNHRIKVRETHVVAKDRDGYVLSLDVDRPRAAYKFLEPMILNKTS